MVSQPQKKVSPLQPKTQKKAKSESTIIEKVEPGNFPLSRTNFYIMIGAAVAIIIGFLLMLGGKSTDEQFNPDIFSTRRIIIGPAIAFLGFVAMAVAIIWTSRKRS